MLKSPRAEEPYGYYFQSTSTIAASAHSSFRSLAEPSSSESLRVVITPACDVYSFGMVMWEMASHVDPFADVPDETEVGDDDDDHDGEPIFNLAGKKCDGRLIEITID